MITLAPEAITECSWPVPRSGGRRSCRLQQLVLGDVQRDLRLHRFPARVTSCFEEAAAGRSSPYLRGQADAVGGNRAASSALPDAIQLADPRSGGPFALHIASVDFVRAKGKLEEDPVPHIASRLGVPLKSRGDLLVLPQRTGLRWRQVIPGPGYFLPQAIPVRCSFLRVEPEPDEMPQMTFGACRCKPATWSEGSGFARVLDEIGKGTPVLGEPG